jgi:hypothetical protein
MDYFPQISLPEPCAHLSPLPYAPYTPPISFFSILPPAQYTYIYIYIYKERERERKIRDSGSHYTPDDGTG